MIKIGTWEIFSEVNINPVDFMLSRIGIRYAGSKHHDLDSSAYLLIICVFEKK